MALFGLFCCNLIQIFEPDVDFDQDGSRYTVMYDYWALFGLQCHYLGYFAVIRIFDPDADFDPNGPKYMPNLL